MDEPEPVAMWARVSARLVVGAGVIAVLSMGWIYWRDRVLPGMAWYDWVIFVCSGLTMFPLFLSVALKGDASWGKPNPDQPPTTKLKKYLSHVYPVALFACGIYYEPVATGLFAILFAFIFLCLGLQVYFMPIKAKLEGIAKAKARHGIPLDQPHSVDRILKSGYFRLP